MEPRLNRHVQTSTALKHVKKYANAVVLKMCAIECSKNETVARWRHFVL